LDAITGGNNQGFTNYGVSGPRLFLASVDGSEFDFLSGWFNEMRETSTDTLRFTAYRDGVLVDTYDFSIDTPIEATPNFTNVDQVYVQGLEGSTLFVFDDLVIA
jgi:hypothetical protein